MGQACSEPHKDVELPDLTPTEGWQQRTYLEAHDVQVGRYGVAPRASESPYQAYVNHQPQTMTSSVPKTDHMASTPASLTQTKLSSQLEDRQSRYKLDMGLQQDAYLLAHNGNILQNPKAHDRIIDWSAHTMKKWRNDPFYEWRPDPDNAPNSSNFRKDWCWQYRDRSDKHSEHLHVVSRIPFNPDTNEGRPEPNGSKGEWKQPQLAKEILLKASGMRDPTLEQRKVGPEGLPVPLPKFTETRAVYTSDARLEKSHQGHREQLLAGPPGGFRQR